MLPGGTGTIVLLLHCLPPLLATAAGESLPTISLLLGLAPEEAVTLQSQVVAMAYQSYQDRVLHNAAPDFHIEEIYRNFSEERDWGDVQISVVDDELTISKTDAADTVTLVRDHQVSGKYSIGSGFKKVTLGIAGYEQNRYLLLAVSHNGLHMIARRYKDNDGKNAATEKIQELKREQFAFVDNWWDLRDGSLSWGYKAAPRAMASSRDGKPRVFPANVKRSNENWKTVRETGRERWTWLNSGKEFPEKGGDCASSSWSTWSATAAKVYRADCAGTVQEEKQDMSYCCDEDYTTCAEWEFWAFSGFWGKCVINPENKSKKCSGLCPPEDQDPAICSLRCTLEHGAVCGGLPQRCQGVCREGLSCVAYYSNEKTNIPLVSNFRYCVPSTSPDSRGPEIERFDEFSSLADLLREAMKLPYKG